MKKLINCWVELPDTCFFSYEEPFEFFSSTTFIGGEVVLIKNITENEEGDYNIEIKTKDKKGTWYGLISGSSWFNKLKVISKEHKRVRRLA